MAIHTLLHVLNFSKAKKSHKLVLVEIANRTNKEGLAWPSYATLARATGLTRQWVIKCVADLEAVGELEIFPLGSPTGGQAYRIPTGQLSLPDEIIPGKLSHQKVVNSVDPNLLNTESLYCKNETEGQDAWLTHGQAVKIGLTPGTRMYRQATGEVLSGE